VAFFNFSEQEELAASHDWHESMILAGTNRMRSIAMTTIAAILTLLPLAFVLGQGSEMQQPLAIAIIVEQQRCCTIPIESQLSTAHIRVVHSMSPSATPWLLITIGRGGVGK
jgi:Cu/Ag efflux pump CusA